MLSLFFGRMTKFYPKFHIMPKFLTKVHFTLLLEFLTMIAGKHKFLTLSVNFSLSLRKSPNLSLSVRIAHYFPRNSHYVLKFSLNNWAGAGTCRHVSCRRTHTGRPLSTPGSSPHASRPDDAMSSRRASLSYAMYKQDLRVAHRGVGLPSMKVGVPWSTTWT
jgi:hypothetical protein